MIATDAVALYPSLEKHETAKRIRMFVEKSKVNFEDIDVSKALVNLKLNKNILRKYKHFHRLILPSWNIRLFHTFIFVV